MDKEKVLDLLDQLRDAIDSDDSSDDAADAAPAKPAASKAKATKRPEFIDTDRDAQRARMGILPKGLKPISKVGNTLQISMVALARARGAK